jgi:hypothetical protein
MGVSTSPSGSFAVFFLQPVETKCYQEESGEASSRAGIFRRRRGLPVPCRTYAGSGINDCHIKPNTGCDFHCDCHSFMPETPGTFPLLLFFLLEAADLRSSVLLNQSYPEKGSS